MSKESAKQFLEKFKEDRSLRESVEKEGEAAIKNYLETKGFKFTKEEIEEAFMDLGGDKYLEETFKEIEVKSSLGNIPYGSPII